MPQNEKYDLDGLYAQGLQHFNRGEWDAAIGTFTELRSLTDEFPQVDDLVADARLKLQLMGTDQPLALAPPKRSYVTPMLIVLALFLLGSGGFIVARALNKPAPPVSAMVIETPTAEPTATQEALPTVTPTVLPPTPVPNLPSTFVVTTAAGTSFVNAPQNIELIVDASGSMLAKVGDSGKQRWQVAQDALRAMLDSGTIPLQSNVGLSTYGRQRGNDCSDMEVPVPLEPYSYERILNVVDKIKPAVRGMTPLAASIRAATDGLKDAKGSGVVVLITDGIESCDGDPVAEAAKFVAAGDGRKLNVIGFAIDDPAASANLNAIAASGHGQYFDASNTGDLAEALRESVVLHYTVTTPSGNEVGKGLVGGASIQLQPGTYHLKVDSSPALEQDITVGGDQQIKVELSQGFDHLTAQVESTPR